MPPSDKHYISAHSLSNRPLTRTYRITSGAYSIVGSGVLDGGGSGGQARARDSTIVSDARARLIVNRVTQAAALCQPRPKPKTEN